MRWTRRATMLALLTAACAAGAAPAQATILFERGNEIWAMNDDGSGAGVLIPLGAAPGMEYLRQPHALPGGGPVVFTGSTTAYQSGIFQFGDNATGVYVWNRGAVARLSGEPGPCTGPAAPHCTSRHTDPEVTADGRYVAELFVSIGNNSPQSTGAIFREGLDNTGYESLATSCGDGDEGGEPSANPANPAQIAYGGVYCSTFDDNTFETTYHLYIGSTLLASDDGVLIGPSWRPDGGALVWAETAASGQANDATAGLYVSDGPGGAKRQVAALPEADILNSPDPRFIGNDLIVFAYDTNYTAADSNDGQGGRDLYVLPASCNSCTLAQATRLTSDGDSQTPAWTAASAADLLPPQSGGGGTGGGGGGDGATDTAAPSVRSSFSARLRLGSVFSRGLPFSLTLGEAATVQTTVSVDGRTARRYRLLTGRRARRARSLAIGRSTRTLAAGRSSVRVKISRKYARKLRRARSLSLKVTISATDAAGNKSTTRKTLRLRR